MDRKTLIQTGALLGGAVTLFGAAAALSASSVKLKKKTVLITGGSRGLGFALAKEFGRKGAQIAIAARDSDELKRAEELLAQEGITAASFVCDLAEPDQIRTLVADVTSRFEAIDIVINNAGQIQVSPASALELADFERAMTLMFWAPLHLSLSVLPQMKKRGEGTIVNITSVGGRVSVPHLLPYSSAKFAAVGFSEGLTAEVAQDGINVVTVVPGLMRTGAHLQAEFKGLQQFEYSWFSVLGNLPGMSVPASYAAQQIRKAVERRKKVCTISLPAKLLIAFHNLLPETTLSLFGLTSAAMPSSTDSEIKKGKEIDPQMGSLFHGATALGEAAAQELNQR